MVGARGMVGVVLVACSLSLVGCTPDAITGPSPPPTPSVQTPTESPAEKQERLDYAAAEESYRTFRAEYGRVLRAGGAKEPTKVMRQTAGGDYLDTFTAVARGYKSAGSREVGQEKIVYVRGDGYEKTSVVLDVCEDSSSTRTIRRSGDQVKGEVRTASLTVKKVGGNWKVWSGTGALVDSCE